MIPKWKKIIILSLIGLVYLAILLWGVKAVARTEAIETEVAEFRAETALFNDLSLQLDIHDKSHIKALIALKSQEWGLNSRIMLDIAACESGFVQFTESGSVLMGAKHPPDRGIFQINTLVWNEVSDLTGYDWRTVEGNIELAMLIASEYGYKQWVCYN